MKTIYKTIIFATAFVFCLALAPAALANQAPVANAGPDLYINSSQTIVLQGSGYDPDGYSLTYYWNCSGGTLSSYNVAQPTYTAPNVYQYNHQATYTCSLNVTDSTGLSNSDSMIVYVNYSQIGNLLTINKTARNMSSGDLSWFKTVYANPSDMLMFMITIRASGSQSVNNVFVRDIFPVNFIYNNQLVVSGSSNYSGDIMSGINLGTISAGQTVTITYQARVAAAQNFNYGTTTLNNSVSVNSSAGYNPTSNVAIIVTRTAVFGATTISTGLTDNLLMDSFLLPLMVALAGIWMFRSGMFFKVEKWVDLRKSMRRDYKTQKELMAKIAQIKQREETVI